MNIRAWFEKAAAKLAALEFFVFEFLGWMTNINPLSLPATVVAFGLGKAVVIVMTASVFFQTARKIASLEAAKIFFDEDDHGKIQDKMARTINATFLYRNIEWIQVGLTVILVSILKYYGFSEWIIFLILWPWCVFQTAPVIFIGDRNQLDITTMEGRRRLFNTLYEISSRPFRIFLAALEAIYGIRLIFWDGPEWFFLFFRKPNDRWPRRKEAVLYIAATGIQMALWTKIYCRGYESVFEVISTFWKQ